MKKILVIAILVCAGSQFVLAQAPRKVILEDYTSVSCGYCPYGKTAMEDVLSTYPNVIGLGIHVNYIGTDPMQNAYTADMDATFNSYGYPGGDIDRYKFSGQSSVVVGANYWKTYCASRLAITSPLNVNISSNYNSSTRQVNIDVTAAFVGSASGDMRINCLLVENNVVTPAYPQHNYMGPSCGAPDPSSEWYSYPCDISNYQHLDVVRAQLAGNDWGDAGVIPSSVSPGQSFTKSYSYTLPAGWNENNVKVVAFVSYYNANVNLRSILNANESSLSGSSGISEIPTNDQEIVLNQNFPNPFNDVTAIQFQLNGIENVSLKVYNMLGQEVSTLVNEKLTSGLHTFYWTGTDKSGNAVNDGIYFYRLVSGSKSLTKQMTVLR